MNGSVQAKALKGSLELETVNGSILGEDLGGLDRGLKASAVNGAITLGLGAIMGARRILLLVSGASKRDILRQALSGTVTTQLPASLLQLHGDVRVIADAQALGRC